METKLHFGLVDSPRRNSRRLFVTIPRVTLEVANDNWQQLRSPSAPANISDIIRFQNGIDGLLRYPLWQKLPPQTKPDAVHDKAVTALRVVSILHHCLPKELLDPVLQFRVGLSSRDRALGFPLVARVRRPPSPNPHVALPSLLETVNSLPVSCRRAHRPVEVSEHPDSRLRIQVGQGYLESSGPRGDIYSHMTGKGVDPVSTVILLTGLTEYAGR